jgi:hypothetical protein
MTAYFNITVIAEWCTFLFGQLLLDKKTGKWQFFILWSFLGLCTETAGWYLHNFQGRDPNALPFNILMIIRSFFFIWLFGDRGKRFTNITRISIVVFSVFAFCNLFFFQGYWQYNSYSESLGDIIIVTLCCYFIFNLVAQTDYINLLGYEYFWLAIGLLFYSMGSAFLYNFYNLLASYRKQTGINVGLYLNYSLNILLSFSLIIAFICRRKATRSLQES